MIKCTRKIEFDAGHRIIGHKNKCQFLHGHRYILEVTAKANTTKSLGMVIDFGQMKLIIKNWIDNNWDHNLILHHNDKVIGNNIEKWTGQKIFYLKQNPTVENLALHFKEDILPKLFTDKHFIIGKVKLFETPNCFVEV